MSSSPASASNPRNQRHRDGWQLGQRVALTARDGNRLLAEVLVDKGRRRSGRILIGCALSAAIFFWLSIAGVTQARNDYASLRGRTVLPLLLPGLVIDLPGLVREQIPSRPVRHWTAIVTSDTCPACQRIVKPLCDFISQEIPPDPTIGWVAVSFDGAILPSALKQCVATQDGSRAIDVVTVRNVTEFGAATGVLGTPSILILDAQFMLRRHVSAYSLADLKNFFKEGR
jgi:hypothetical protein